jgi:AraC-like DNA-binding protein
MELLTAAGAVFESLHVKNSTLGFHRHGVAFATIVLDGSYTEVRHGVAHSFSRGAIVVHDASEEHADYFLGDARCLNVELPAGIETGEPLNGNAALRAAAAHVRLAFYDEPALLETAVKGFLALLRSPQQAPAAAPPDWLKPVLEAFEWCDPVPLRGAARLAGVHPVQFSRAFHRHVGMTSNEYRRQSRLRRASKLLLESTVSLVRVAQDCGFADQSHLTRTFSESVGLSPAHYRQVFAR